MSNSIKLEDGGAEYMGDGVFVIRQQSDDGPQSVVLSVGDLGDLGRLSAAVG